MCYRRGFQPGLVSVFFLYQAFVVVTLPGFRGDPLAPGWAELKGGRSCGSGTQWTHCLRHFLESGAQCLLWTLCMDPARSQALDPGWREVCETALERWVGPLKSRRSASGLCCAWSRRGNKPCTSRK